MRLSTDVNPVKTRLYPIYFFKLTIKSPYEAPVIHPVKWKVNSFNTFNECQLCNQPYYFCCWFETFL